MHIVFYEWSAVSSFMEKKEMIEEIKETLFLRFNLKTKKLYSVFVYLMWNNLKSAIGEILKIVMFDKVDSF